MYIVVYEVTNMDFLATSTRPPPPASIFTVFEEAPFNRAAMERNNEGPGLPGEEQFLRRITEARVRLRVEGCGLSAGNSSDRVKINP
jgi:hypothetical protein